MNNVENIKRLLVEFDDGKRALLNADDQHEWVVSCRPKEIDFDTWTKGALSEIEDYVRTWVFLAGIEQGSTQPLITHLEDLLGGLKKSAN